MDATQSRSGRTSRRDSRRARRVRWAATLAALAAAASMASAQAAQHERATQELEAAFECSTGVRMGYDVGYSEELGGFGVEGMVVEALEPACAGRDAVVILANAKGEALASGSFTVAEGASVQFDAGTVVDASDVASVQVLAGA